MAQNNKNAARRELRAQRRAAQEEAERQAQEQAQKERRQQTIIGAIAVALVVVLVAVAGFAIWRATRPSPEEAMSVEQAYNQLQEVSTKPSKASDKGGILVSKNGYNKPVEGAPTVDIYMDFICPGCGSLHRNLDTTTTKMVDAGQLNLNLHFMAFMDRASTDEYSSRAATAALYITDHDNDVNHLLQFIQNMYAEDFQPEEGSGYKSVSNEQIREQAIKAGVSKDVADKLQSTDYKTWIDAINTYIPKLPEVQHQKGSYKGTFTSPAVVINGTYWDISDVTAAQLSMPAAFTKALGISQDEVGVEGVMPSIGADGKPIALS